jgi:hypothetical protein
MATFSEYSPFRRTNVMMQKVAGIWTTLVAVVVLIGAGAGLARASVDALDAVHLAPSAIPELLGPINAHGRAGWDCAPERAAQAANAAHAELPIAPDR